MLADGAGRTHLEPREPPEPPGERRSYFFLAVAYLSAGVGIALSAGVRVGGRTGVAAPAPVATFASEVRPAAGGVGGAAGGLDRRQVVGLGAHAPELDHHVLADPRLARARNHGRPVSQRVRLPALPADTARRRPITPSIHSYWALG